MSFYRGSSPGSVSTERTAFVECLFNSLGSTCCEPFLMTPIDYLSRGSRACLFASSIWYTIAPKIPPTVVLALSISQTTLSNAWKSQFFVSSSTLASLCFRLRSSAPVLGLDEVDLTLCEELAPPRDGAPALVSGLLSFAALPPFAAGFPFSGFAASSASF